MSSMASGYVRWSTTTYWIDETAIHHHTGLLRERDTKVPLERVEGFDVHQGPLQRAFGVFAVDVQTGAAKKGGEIALPALTPAAVDELRAFRVPVEPAEGTAGRSEGGWSGRELAVAALTAGTARHRAARRRRPRAGGPAGRRGGEAGRHALPPSLRDRRRRSIVLGLLVLAWLLSTLGSVVAFGGFTIVREQERIRSGAASCRATRRRCRSAGYGPCASSKACAAAVRAVRADRRGHGLCRRGDRRPDDVPAGAGERGARVPGGVPARAGRRRGRRCRGRRRGRHAGTSCCPCCSASRSPSGRGCRRRVRHRGTAADDAVRVGTLAAAGWRLEGGRLAVRELRIARVTVLAPARLRESHTYTQNLFQRRAGPRRPVRRVRQEHHGAHPPPRGGGCARGVLEQPVAHGRVAELEAGRDRARREPERPVQGAGGDRGQRARDRADVSVLPRGRSASARSSRSRIGTRCAAVDLRVSWRRSGSM